MRRSAPAVARLAARLAALALGVLTAPTARAQPQAPAAALPDTPLGRLAGRFVQAVNDGDSAAVARFVAAHLGDDGWRGTDAAARTRTLLRLRAQSGGLDVVQAGTAGTALRVFTRTRVGARMLGLEFEPAPGDTTRLAAADLHPMDPALAGGPPAPWAEGALADDALAAVVRARVRDAAAADRFSGVVLVAHGDRVLVHEAVGFADRARRRPNTRATLFQTTSVGKMFTAVAVAQLVRDGRLTFDDTLARALPTYPNADAARRVTVRQLLTHTAGVPEPFFSPRFGGVPDTASHAALLATFADAPLTMAPGAAHAYSNGNYLALAAVVERASGLRFEDYLRRRVWGPAGMRAVAHPAWGDLPELAVPYARFSYRDPLGLEPRTAAAPPAHAYRGPVRGFGGGAYTAEDLFRFARALRTGRLLGPAMTDTLVAGRLDTGHAPPGLVQYGFGVYATRRDGGARVVGHPGSNPNTGWDADVELVWDRDWTVVVLSNYDAPAGIALTGPIVRLIAAQQPSARRPTVGAAEGPRPRAGS